MTTGRNGRDRHAPARHAVRDRLGDPRVAAARTGRGRRVGVPIRAPKEAEYPIGIIEIAGVIIPPEKTIRAGKLPALTAIHRAMKRAKEIRIALPVGLVAV
jgi:hypothetical protein